MNSFSKEIEEFNKTVSDTTVGLKTLNSIIKDINSDTPNNRFTERDFDPRIVLPKLLFGIDIPTTKEIQGSQNNSNLYWDLGELALNIVTAYMTRNSTLGKPTELLISGNQTSYWEMIKMLAVGKRDPDSPQGPISKVYPEILPSPLEIATFVSFVRDKLGPAIASVFVPGSQIPLAVMGFVQSYVNSQAGDFLYHLYNQYNEPKEGKLLKNNYTPTLPSQNNADYFWTTHTPDLPDYLKRKDDDDVVQYKENKSSIKGGDFGLGLEDNPFAFGGFKNFKRNALSILTNNQKKKTQQKRQKVRKPPKPKTTPDEDFRDEFINNLYNQIKTAFELKGAKFDKSKLLTEVIDFKNEYAEAFGQEIDYKKEVGILQDKLNSLTGEDAETLKERVELQEKLNELNEKDFKNKLQSHLSGFTVKSLDNIADELYGKTTDDYETPGRNYSIPSDHYRKRPPRGQRAGGLPEEEKDGARVSDAYGTNRNPAKLAKGQDPYKVFEQAYGEARKLGGSLNTIMRNLHIRNFVQC
ncbi:MAG: hypothetical protein JST55_14515 [Bacteroidetes bacterium]|nr:hypothetical protein [Bacteroidota bacterium]